MAKSSQAFRGNRVAAYDSKYTGEEPTWDPGLSDEALAKEYHRMFRFYGYYLGAKELAPDLHAWMKAKGGYTADQISLFKEFPVWCVSETAGKLARCLNRGMPEDRIKAVVGEDPTAFVRNAVEEAFKTLSSQYNTPAVAENALETTTQSAKAVSPVVLLEKKLRGTVGLALDELTDTWMKSGDTAEPIKMASLLAAHNVPGMGTSIVEQFVKKIMKEFIGARDKTCDELVEGYSYLSKKGLNNRIKACEIMLDDLVKVSHSIKALRKPRVKKPTSAEKQIAKLRFMKASADYGVSSVSPMSIPDSNKVFVFNTKNRVLTILVADSDKGLSVKGSTIRGYDEKASTAIRLRKPNDILPEIISRTPKQIEKALGSLTTKPSKPNGRMNEQTVILRVFASR